MGQRWGSGSRRHHHLTGPGGFDLARKSGDERLAIVAEIDLACTLAVSGQGQLALEQLDRFADEALRRGEPWININLLWTYSLVFAVLGDPDRAATLQGAFEAASAADDFEYPMAQGNPEAAALAERCYAQVRPLIDPQGWEQAHKRGALLILRSTPSPKHGEHHNNP